MLPTRKILTQGDMTLFLESSARAEFVEFITRLNEAVVDVRTRDPVEANPNVDAVIALLLKLRTWVKEIPPVDNAKSRFGNPAFRTFYDKVKDEIAHVLEPLDLGDNTEEVGVYLIASFGDRERIDYGTGHEAAFMAFLLCLEKLGKFDEKVHAALVTRVFFGYIALMRDLQFHYWLEPAGSHGVWGLDDYHFLPFLFGSAQLRSHRHIRPKSIHDADIIEEFSPNYMYLACIQFINEVKTESLRWHSPMLDDISGVKTWAKVNEGMLKMYKVEVLEKLPIMQHFLFGTLIAFEGESRPEDLEEAEEECGHVHALGKEAPTCCGTKVPSVFGASQAAGARRLPFD